MRGLRSKITHRYEVPCRKRLYEVQDTVHNLNNGPVVQLVRTPACHAGGREFEPHPGRHYASVAQSVEHGTENPSVGGSIPPGSTNFTIHFVGCEDLREWLSGRASPCQGERREFESRLPLHYLRQKTHKCVFCSLF